jgi:hypothetical protein
LRILVIVAAAAAPLAVTGWYLADRAAENAAKALAKGLGRGSELSVALKGAWGRILLEGVSTDQLADVRPGGSLASLLNDSNSGVSAEGLLDAYHKDPGKFKRYAEVSDTWFHALTVADAVQRLATNAPVPSTSVFMTAFAPQYRLDAWGHPFCIFKGTDQTAIVSAGPEAQGFTSCNEVRVTRAQIDRLPVVPITRQPSGALIMVFKRHAIANPN